MDESEKKKKAAGKRRTPKNSDGEADVKLKVVIHKAEEGGYWATVPALPGCVTEGETWDETLANVREAIECYLDVPAADVPDDANVEEIEV